MCSVALVCGEYAITRPTSNALFLTIFSFKTYPWVWLATVPLNLQVIYLYNKFLPKIGPKLAIFWLAIATLSINTATGLLFPIFPQIIFLQFAWKDIYVLLMLKQVWSMIHSTIAPASAKYLYGCIYAVGTVGAISGSLIPSFLAITMGSEQILLLTFPLYLLLMASYAAAFRRSPLKNGAFEEKLTPDPRPSEAFALIRRTPILLAVLLLVIFMQVSVALAEYRFNAHLELNILDKNLRTAYCGQLSGLINTLSLIFQFLGSYLLVKMLGLKRSHFVVPVLLFCAVLISLIFPTFAVISLSYVFLKAIDFSLFGVIREMLYVPLQLDAKFRAKAIIDVFTYRTSKALVSFGLLGLQIVGSIYLLDYIGYVSLFVFVAWLVTVRILYKNMGHSTTSTAVPL